MNKNLRCAICLAVACYCAATPALAAAGLAPNNADKLGRGVVIALASGATLSATDGTVYYMNTTIGTDIQVRQNPFGPRIIRR